MEYREVYQKVFDADKTYNQMRGGFDICTSHLGAVWFLDRHIDLIHSILDVGSGRGALMELMRWRFHPSLEPLLSVDCNKFNQSPVPFKQVIISELPEALDGRHFDYVTCTDVLEHIEPNETEDALERLSRCGTYAFFAIATTSHVMLGQELHINRRSRTEWLALLQKHFTVLESERFADDKVLTFGLASRNRG